MDKYYQTDGIHSYFVLSQTELLQDSYETDMVINNDFSELIRFDPRVIDNRQQIYYVIDGLIPVEALMENNELKYQQVIELMDALVDLIYKLYEYLLSPNDLILEWNSIFYNREQQSFCFLYLPGNDKEIRIQIKELTEQLLRITCHKEKEGVDFIYGLYEIVQYERYDLSNMRKHIKHYSGHGTEHEHHTLINEETDTKDNDKETKENVKSISEDVKEVEQESVFMIEEDKREKERLINLLFSKEQKSQNREIKDNHNYQYKILFSVMIGITILAGAAWVFIELQEYHQLYHIKPLMIIFILMVIEIFVYMGVDKEYEEEAYEIEKKGTNNRWEIDDRLKTYHSVQTDDRLETDHSVQTDDILETAYTTVLPTYEQETTVLSKIIPKYKLVPVGNVLVSQMLSCSDGFKQYSVPTCAIDTVPIIIGRNHSHSDCCIMDDSISRRHAKIYREDEKVLLVDLNSTNGTFVNEYPVLSGYPVIITEGDYIRFGAVSYHMERESY